MADMRGARRVTVLPFGVLGWTGRPDAVPEARTDESLFASLVDDAGTFPPELLTMPAAVRRHRSDVVAGDPVHTNRFLCRVADLHDLLGQLRADDAFELALIGAEPLDTLDRAALECADQSRVSLVAVEHPLTEAGPAGLRAALAATPWISGRLTRYVEIPQPGPEDLLKALHDQGCAAKLRCGGLRSEFFPSCEALASTVHGLIAVGVPFKATAGLHRAVRYRDDRTGFTHHGFLNLLVAVAAAVNGAALGDIVRVLEQTDPDALVCQVGSMTLDVVTKVRQAFMSYGSCSTAEPVDELAALGLIHREGKLA
jgi:hypothetical protein